MSLSHAEQNVIAALSRRGKPIIDATVIVIITARSLSRSRAQLVDIVLRGYPGLESKTDTNTAVGNLIASGWLVELSTFSGTVCTAAPDIIQRIADYVDDQEIAHRLSEARSLQDPSITLLGPINSEEKYSAFFRGLHNAKCDIRLPFLATPATIERLSELENRSRQGVRLRILVASPDVVARVRGESQRARGRESVEGWTTLTKNWPNTEVRVARSPIDILMAASCSFDESRAQLAVYDIWHQRSQESTAIEVYQNEAGLNLVTLFNQHFDAAWNRARPTRGASRFIWWIKRLGWELVLLISVILTVIFLISVPALGNIAGGVAATALVTLMVRYRDALGRIFHRLRGQ